MDMPGIAELEPSDIGAGYPADLDIIFYDDGKWRYVASLPDDEGGYRDASIFEASDGSWGFRINEFTGNEADEGFARERWEGGYTVDVGGTRSLTSTAAIPMSYEAARGSAEKWVRNGSLADVAVWTMQMDLKSA